eukprot:314216-Pleurochrysis_carterae.AAC.1
MQRLSPKGIRCPAATLRRKIRFISPTADKDMWDIFFALPARPSELKLCSSQDIGSEVSSLSWNAAFMHTTVCELLS